jgi:DNA-binding Lrp family transcriptional regulator
MDELDFKILNRVQEGLPIDENPFYKIAMEIGIDEEELIKRLKNIKDSGFIRRIGAVFDSSKMGYNTTLVGIKVPKKDIFNIVNVINSYNEVTHNYYRVNGQKDFLNIWFTLSTKDEEKRKHILFEISNKPGVEKIYEFPKILQFKLEVFFDMEDM